MSATLSNSIRNNSAFVLISKKFWYESRWFISSHINSSESFMQEIERVLPSMPPPDPKHQLRRTSSAPLWRLYCKRVPSKISKRSSSSFAFATYIWMLKYPTIGKLFFFWGMLRLIIAGIPSSKVFSCMYIL